MRVPVGLVALGLLSGAALAQDQQPYAASSARAIKSLSDQQIADLKEGRGMGLALAAELNGYPGPRHAIELAKPLGLTDEQLVRLQALFLSMKSETVAIGERLIAQEAALNDQFARKTISPDSLATAVRDIGTTQAELRTAHLRYHLLALDILSPQQARRYGELRGYLKPGAHNHASHPG